MNVTAVVPCCENRISTTSLLPGDLIGSLSGKTIEVFNADAEGRLILADGLTWAIRKEGCTHLVDAATLTGRDLRHARLCGHGRYGERRRLVCRARAGCRPLPASAGVVCRLPGI